MRFFSGFSALILCVAACQSPQNTTESSSSGRLQPVIVTETVKYDTDDPAIWIHPTDPAQSLVIGTDKNPDGALYVFDLQGKIIENKVVRGLQYPNNVDIEYGFLLGGKSIDIAVVTERERSMIRIFSLPDMKAIDGGGIEVFVGETGEEYRMPMGISIYKRPSDSAIFAIVGRKNGPAEGYLWQYRLSAQNDSTVKATFVRKLGAYSGKAEIESIAVDDALGHIYYSDETVGVHQYPADPEKGSVEIALFATQGFTEDHEGISIYPTGDSTGYILVSDQQANAFHVFTREGNHAEVAILPCSTNASDGSEVTATPLLPLFPKGLFVAMSSDRTFQYYSWEAMEKLILAK
ncbi:MAG: phytase [Bacteroidetes bacterium]|nr:MAG: phytase [Bacteroidota bacterium]